VPGKVHVDDDRLDVELDEHLIDQGVGTGAYRPTMISA
jgi:hypothetical protein